jgi:hypothetical protein
MKAESDGWRSETFTGDAEAKIVEFLNSENLDPQQVKICYLPNTKHNKGIMAVVYYKYNIGIHPNCNCGRQILNNEPYTPNYDLDVRRW